MDDVKEAGVLSEYRDGCRSVKVEGLVRLRSLKKTHAMGNMFVAALVAHVCQWAGLMVTFDMRGLS